MSTIFVMLSSWRFKTCKFIAYNCSLSTCNDVIVAMSFESSKKLSIIVLFRASTIMSAFLNQPAASRRLSKRHRNWFNIALNALIPRATKVFATLKGEDDLIIASFCIFDQGNERTLWSRFIILVWCTDDRVSQDFGPQRSQNAIGIRDNSPNTNRSHVLAVSAITVARNTK